MIDELGQALSELEAHVHAHLTMLQTLFHASGASYEAAVVSDVRKSVGRTFAHARAGVDRQKHRNEENS